MRLIGPIFFRIFLVVAGFFVVFGALTQCASSALIKSKKTIEQQFEDKAYKPKFYTYEVDGRAMHYVQVGDIHKPMVIFVHGSPGGWDAYIDYFKDSSLTAIACLVSVDRAGYGGSGSGIAEPSLEAQGTAIAPILATSRAKEKPILVGHSLGGPIVARMAMDYPNAMKSIIMLAPSIDPEMENNEWWRHILKSGIVRAVMPPALVSSNLELMPLEEELNKMLPLWKNIRVPCTIMHGKKDMLVPYENVAFFKKMLVNAPKKEVVTFEKENHFIPWTKYDSVKMKIVEHLNY
jgi:pimeloyl-ACP methyl ester carboxylesterase